MRVFLWLTALCLLGNLIAGPSLAQDPVPDHRYLYTRDTDLPGTDLAQLFDTTQDACARACSAQDTCVAFTFNTRSKACFPKSAVGSATAYVGAISARKVVTPPALTQSAARHRAQAPFLSDADIASANEFVATNTRRFTFGGETTADLIAALSAAEQSGDTRAALRWAGKAAALSDRPDLWTSYARLALIHAKTAKRAEQRQTRSEALSAAINGYLRAESPALQVEALRVLAQVLEMTNRGRDMIPALRQALAVQPRDDLEQALEKAIGKYGFRVTENRSDNDAAAPRICVQFSENLVQAGVDYEPFVRVEGRGMVVQVDDSQLCIDGVAHGQRYSVTLRAGLPSASGEVLNRDVTVQQYVRDRAPTLRFPGRAYVLPRSADAALPIETVNTSTLDLRLRRVSDRNLVRAIRESYFGRPLSGYEDDQFSADMAEEIWTGTAEVQNELNVDMTTRLPMGEALQGQSPGIYTLSAAVPGQDRYDSPPAMQWFVLSDLGLTTWAGIDGMQVAVRGLSDAAPREGITVSLISRANAVLGSATTDAQGFARFAAGLTRGTGAARPALLMAEDGDKDIAFLSLTDPAFDLSDRGVEGNPPAPPIDTFLTTDRGAYRVGETIFATVLTRDAQAAALTGLPVTAILKRPDGVEYARHLSTNAQAGGHVFALPLGADVPRGAWRLDILSDLDAPALASQVLLVEDFLPERLDFDLTLPDAALRLAQTPPLHVDVRYLFGAPGAGLTVEGDLRLRPAAKLAGWEGYRFGRHDAGFRTRTSGIGDAKTNAQGRATVALELPTLDQDPGLPLEAEVILRVAEGSGRPVERRLTRAITSDDPLIGIKPRFEGTLPEGSEAAFDLIAVGPDGSAVDMPVRWTLNRVETRYQWYQLYGNWEWEPTTRRIRVQNGDVMLGQTPTTVTAPTEWGRYELIVERTGTPYAASSIPFSSGWYGGDSATDTPDRLELSLDAEDYAPGDTATLRLVAQDAGVALVSVLSNRVIERRVVPVAAGENTVSLTVTADWGTGAYVTASVLRGMDVAAGQNPSRQMGLVHAAVRPGTRALNVSIDAPEATDGQAGGFLAAVQVDGLDEGDTAYVTLAAVDLGILNLTGFTPPIVTGHYFGQRRLGVELRDIYGRLIDGMNGAMGVVRSGGDAAATAQVQSPPPTEKLMAFFSGPVTVGPEGRAEIEIEKPAFNGTMRLMAVAWSDTAVGQATRDVIAADPVVVSASLPRFLAPGDTSRLLLEFTHTSGPAGEIPLKVYTDAAVALGKTPETVTMTPQGTAQLNIPVTGRELGDPVITVVLTTPDGTELRKSFTLPVRDNDPEVSTTRQFTLGVGESFTFDTEVFAGFRPGIATATLTAGPLARFDVPGLLQQLDRYPYGCTEQVTSGALPLLYLSSLAQDAGLGTPDRIEDKISQSITRILSRQASNGAFGLWGAGSGEFWLDAYVTDFLSRARAQGHAVPDLAFSLAMDNLRNRISYAPDFDKGGEDIAYALLVLAREGAARMGDLRYYADTKAQDFATPLAVAQLGAALAAYGDPVRADALFAHAGRMLNAQTDTRVWRDDFGSPLRDAAAVLRLGAEAGSAVLDKSVLSNAIQGGGASLSTQEAAQVVMAAHALAAPQSTPDLRVDGVPATGRVVQRLSDQTGGASVIENVSARGMDVTMTAFGVPEVAPEAGGYGYQITRRILTMEGEPVSDSVASGERLVVVLKVTPFEEIGARLIIDDPLAAGFEIDNPNLIRSGDIAALDWLKAKQTETAEFRSDRFVAAVNHSGTDPFELAYILRAVSPGTYHHPAATVEDMYRPEYRANTATAQVTITP
ncbi:Alpha-2-macroglobulin N-terminal domain family protein [Sulfitobacter noctilucae]|uniref:alpha-2-macroglobulin family protein n=1 Tax=Sulfitobacter noctilucae TaxID=1342302 RepID=UPI00046ADD88|nr:alpha-2-macroglobulin family protein [Sulfitobacter noctilucae]KIN75363.1 Alpha-2-macroglobulin N-terminal domain family protein [Sulfitobacter noctilucae]